MEVKADLGAAFEFAEYDHNKNIFKVHSKLLEPKHVGDYMIRIEARFYNATYEETFKGQFFLTVWDDPPPEPEPWRPEDPIEYQVWDGSIKENMIPEPYDPEKPVPHIVSLSQDGVMQIGWDRDMVPPGNYTVIPETQVAVRSWDETERRRQL